MCSGVWTHFRASNGMRPPLPGRGRRGCRPRPSDVPADAGQSADPAARLRVPLVAVLVIQVGVAFPGRLKRVGQRRDRGALDEAGADVLPVRRRRVHQLCDAGERLGVVDLHLHLLVCQGLLRCRWRAAQVCPDRAPRAGGPRRVADRVHGVTVDEQGAFGDPARGPPTASTALFQSPALSLYTRVIFTPCRFSNAA